MKITTSFLPLILASTGLAASAMAQQASPPAAPPAPPAAPPDIKPLADIIGKLASDGTVQRLLENVDLEKLMNDENVRKALKDIDVGEVLKNVDLGKLMIEGNQLLGQMRAEAGDDQPDRRGGALGDLRELRKIMPPGAHDAGWRIGVVCAPVNPMLREHLDLPKDSGLMVTEVQAGGPAAKAGIQKNDIVLSANQQMVGTPNALIESVQNAGTHAKPVVMDIIHQGKRSSVTVQPEGPPTPRAAGDQAGPHPMAGALAEQAHQLQELRELVNQQQRAINQLRKQIAELRRDREPAPDDHR